MWLERNLCLKCFILCWEVVAKDSTRKLSMYCMYSPSPEQWLTAGSQGSERVDTNTGSPQPRSVSGGSLVSPCTPICPVTAAIVVVAGAPWASDANTAICTCARTARTVTSVNTVTCHHCLQAQGCRGEFTRRSKPHFKWSDQWPHVKHVKHVSHVSHVSLGHWPM